MSLKALDWAIYAVRDDLDLASYRILLIMADNADGDGRGQPIPIWEFAAHLDTRDLDGVRARIDTLLAAGIIEPAAGGTPDRPAYDLVMDDGDTTDTDRKDRS